MMVFDNMAIKYFPGTWRLITWNETSRKAIIFLIEENYTPKPWPEKYHLKNI